MVRAKLGLSWDCQADREGDSLPDSPHEDLTQIQRGEIVGRRQSEAALMTACELPRYKCVRKLYIFEGNHIMFHTIRALKESLGANSFL